MQTPTQVSKPQIDNSILSFLETLKEFGIEFFHSPDYKAIWIPIDKIFVDVSKFTYIGGHQGDTEITLTKYPNNTTIYIRDPYEGKLVILSNIQGFGFRYDKDSGTIFIEF
jgi:hypothetical protein